MKYSFQCPAPYNYEIKVDTQADDSSVAKKMTRSHAKALQNNCWFCDRQERVSSVSLLKQKINQVRRG